MSLASFVANFFSGSTSTQREDRNDLGFADYGLPGGKGSFVDVTLGTAALMPETVAQKADEEEGRPPYLHVRLYIAHIKLQC